MEEFSAGGIVYRKGLDSRQSLQAESSGRGQNDIFVLVSQHSGHHGWVFPKGHVGDTIKGETAEEAAIREVQEETGITGNILKKLPLTDYWYKFQGQKRHKTVQYFLMEYVSGDIANHGWEMENAVWLPVEKVEQKLTYKGDKNVWEKAEKLLQ